MKNLRYNGNEYGGGLEIMNGGENIAEQEIFSRNTNAAEQTMNNKPAPQDKFEEIDMNIRKLARQRRFGHIALLDGVTGRSGDVTQKNPASIVQKNDRRNLGRIFLRAIADNAASASNIVNSIDIECFVRIAKVIKGDVNTKNFPYFVTDLFILLASWENEAFNPQLIEDHYIAWLISLWDEYE